MITNLFRYFIYERQAEVTGTYDGGNNTGKSQDITATSYPSLGRPVALSPTTMAVISTVTDTLGFWQFNGTNWVVVGTPFALGTTSNLDICALSATEVAVVDGTNGTLSRYSWNGSTWSLVGSALTISGMANPSVAKMTATSVSYFDTGNDSLRCYSHNGSTWSLVGSGLTITTTTRYRMSSCSATRIFLLAGATGQLRAYNFNGSTWSQGTGTVSPDFSFFELCDSQEEDVACVMISPSGTVHRYRYDGSSFSEYDAFFLEEDRDLHYFCCLPPTDLKISGTVSLDASPVVGATIRAFRQRDNVLVGETESDASGDYLIEGMPDDSPCHVLVECTVSGQKYNAFSLWDIVSIS